MQLYFPLLIQIPAIAGALYVILTIIWLLSRAPLSSFRKIALAFMLTGAIIPLVVLLLALAVRDISGVAIVLCPSSILVMGLEGPTPQPWSTIVFVYGFIILCNVGLYGTVGLIVGWAYARFRRSIVGG